MSVVLIGDRAVGKTSMILALANQSNSQNVELINSEPEQILKYGNLETNNVASTGKTNTENLSLKITLPSGRRDVNVKWVDSPGEFWENKQSREDRSFEWQDLQKEVRESKAVILLLDPYRELLERRQITNIGFTNSLEPDEFKTQKQWKNRLDWWLGFFQQNCSQVDHILFCIHKADLFCNFEVEGNNWQYEISGSHRWYQYDDYVKQKYFMAIHDSINANNLRSIKRKLKFFMTTIKNRSLLELPWIYLGAYLANE